MRILYGVSSVGLGHARRSLAIAQYLRKSRNDLEIDWITSEPVVSFLEHSGERVLPISYQLQSLSPIMEQRVRSGRLDDMSQVARTSSSIAKKNYFVLKPELEKYAVLIQDEFAETIFSFMWDSKATLPPKRVLITDYVRFESHSRIDSLSKITLWYANRMLSKAFEKASLRIFADDLDAIPQTLREKVNKSFEIVGPIVSKAPSLAKEELRKKLLDTWNKNPETKRLIVVTIGGTSIGEYLVDFLYENSEEISGKLDCHIVVLLGPRLQASDYSEKGKSEFTFVPFSVNSLEYFKAADCIVAQAGASTLNEVASLGVPCVVIPIENHFEQEANALRFSEKLGFVVLRYRDLTASSFVGAVNKALGTSYVPQFSRSAAEKAAALILKLISE
jgi:predicted glycosyltransferase